METLSSRTALLAAMLATPIFCPAAIADVVLNLNNFNVGSSGNLLLASPGSVLQGVVTGVSIDAFMTQSSSSAIQANYAMLYFGAPVAGFLATVGSLSNPYPGWQNPQWSSWPVSSPGALLGRVDFSQPFSGSSVTSLGLVMPGASSTEWLQLSGTLTLHGVNMIPAPGSIALLGIAGLTGSRRRR
jgi:hypothetical protein